MPEPLLFVPFRNEDYSLYKISFTDESPVLTWSIKTASSQSRSISEKLKNLKKYFEQRHFKKDISGSFQGINIKDGTFFEQLTDSTSSIFLGLFLAAAQKIQQRKILCPWATVTVTGELDYNYYTGEMKLTAVGDIYEKYQAAKAYAKEHTNDVHLFISIGSDERILEDKNEYLKVRCFSEKDSIFDIMDFIFEPYMPNMEIHELDDSQRRLLRENDKRQGNCYISTPLFEKNLQKAFAANWKGFYIYGEGASGKSAMAGALIHYLMWVKKIHAPIWMEISGTSEFPEINDEYFVNIINERLKIKGDRSELENVFSEKQYLICFDIINIDNARLSELLKEIDAFIDTFYNFRPYLIIINRNHPDEDRLPDNIRGLIPIEPPELRQEEIKILINYFAEHGGYLKNIEDIKDTEDYKLFFSEIVSRLGYTPGLISPAVNMLRRKTAAEALSLLQNTKDKNLQEKVIALYESSFQFLSRKDKIILFLILNCTEPDIPVSKEELFKAWPKIITISERELKRKDIDESFDTLLDNNFIYRTEESGISKYAVKTHCFLVFSFAEEFMGEFDNERGKYVRELGTIYYWWKSYIALRYDQDIKYVEPTFTDMKAIYTEEEFTEYVKFNLFIAAEYSSNTENLELIKNYLNGNIDIQDEDGETPFQRASAFNPNMAVIEWFLDNLDEKAIYRKGLWGLNAFLIAVNLTSNPEILKLLIQRGKFDPYKRIKTGLFSAYTPFLMALQNNTNQKICNYFIDELHCDVNEFYRADVTKDINNSDIEENFDYENMEHVNLKELRRFFRNNMEDFEKDLKRSVLFPVLFAIKNPNIKILEKVLSKHVDLENIKKLEEVPLLHIAALIVSRVECFELLIKNGCEIQERCEEGFTALHRAAFINGSRQVLNLFVKNGIDINAPDNAGFTPFHAAASYNSHPDIIEWFIEQGADINKQDNFGKTPLHYAVEENQNPEIYQRLVIRGADMNIKDEEGFTPLQYARQYKLKDRVKWLKEHSDLSKKDN